MTRTRTEILAAAHACFTRHGYTDTSIRRIAAAAQVDPALVMHFFGTKDALFGAALQEHPPLGGLLEHALAGAPDEVGERLVAHYLDCWEAPDTGPWIAAVTRAAATSSTASAALAAFMTDEVMLPLARHVGGERADLRANLAGAHIYGLGHARYILRVAPLASLTRAEVTALVGPAVQRCLSGPLGVTREITG